MVHLGDVGHVGSRFYLFGDSVSVGARWVHSLCQTYLGLTNPFDAPMMRLYWKLTLSHLEIVLIWLQDRCTVCAEHTTGSKIILDAPDGTPR
jgi:hypothetical protein